MKRFVTMISAATALVLHMSRGWLRRKSPTLSDEQGTARANQTNRSRRKAYLPALAHRLVADTFMLITGPAAHLPTGSPLLPCKVTAIRTRGGVAAAGGRSTESPGGGIGDVRLNNCAGSQ